MTSPDKRQIIQPIESGEITLAPASPEEHCGFRVFYLQAEGEDSIVRVLEGSVSINDDNCTEYPEEGGEEIRIRNGETRGIMQSMTQLEGADNWSVNRARLLLGKNLKRVFPFGRNNREEVVLEVDAELLD